MAVVQRIKDSRIRLHHQPNAGPGAARNAGACLSRAAFLTFLDADDEWCPNLLTTAMAKLEAYPRCGVFTASFFIEPSHQDRWSSLRGFYEGEWAIDTDISKDALMDCIAAFHSCTCVYRKEVFEKFGGFYTKDGCTLGEDVYLWVSVMLNSALYRHMHPLAFYHMEDSELGVSSRLNRQLPLEPVLTNPRPIYLNCPPDLQKVLNLWLAQHAWRAAALQLQRGNKANASFLIDNFPSIKKSFPLEYLKLKLRMISPSLWSRAETAVRHVRTTLNKT